MASQPGVFNPQQFTDAGLPAASYRLYTYAAGTTTQKTAYTDAAGAVAHSYTSDGLGSQFIALNSRGELPAPLFLASGAYDIALKTPAGVTVWTRYAAGAFEDSAALRSDLASTASGKGAALVARFGGGTMQDAFDAASGKGAEIIGYLPRGTGAIGRTVKGKLDDTVSVFDFMTTAQVADVVANTAATNLAGAMDVTAAIQAAINHAATRSSVGGVVHFPPGSYKVTSTIYTYGASATGQVSLVGNGPFSTRFFPSGDFTVINDTASYGDTGGFSIEWPVTLHASIPTARIGIELAGADWQASYTTKRRITVMYAYRGFVLNDWTGQPFGTVYLCKLQSLSAFRCADWGIWINSKVGSTTLLMEQCYVRGDNTVGAQAGKGIFVNNVDDVTLLGCAVDQCLDNWVQVQNASVTTMLTLALEACRMTSAAEVAVNINSLSASINGLKTISCNYSTGGVARVVSVGANTNYLSLSGYHEQGVTIGGGTTRYKAATNAANSFISVLDRSILPTEVQHNGWHSNFTFEGVRLSLSSLAPSYGTWLRGDYVRNGAPSVGSPKGWVCTVAGTSGTWVSEGNL